MRPGFDHTGWHAGVGAEQTAVVATGRSDDEAHALAAGALGVEAAGGAGRGLLHWHSHKHGSYNAWYNRLYPNDGNEGSAPLRLTPPASTGLWFSCVLCARTDYSVVLCALRAHMVALLPLGPRRRPRADVRSAAVQTRATRSRRSTTTSWPSG